MINKNKWISSLPNINQKFNGEKNQTDHYRWINTIPKKTTYHSVKKYSLMTALFICGLLVVSVVKNETRNLEKEINNLRTSNNVIKFNLEQAILDNEVITSPENISKLAKEYLNKDFVSYKKSQIKKLEDDIKIISKSNKKNNNLSGSMKLKITKKIKETKTKIRKLQALYSKPEVIPGELKTQVAKKIKETKTEIRKLQALYAKPEAIPGELKTQVAKKIEEKKIELKNLYSHPKETVTLKKAQKWAAIQVVKVFLGLPVIPGR